VRRRVPPDSVSTLQAGVWQLKGIRRNTGKGSCPLRVCLGEEDVRYYWIVWQQLEIGELNF